MFIKKIQIKNFKSLKDSTLSLFIPDQTTPGSGLNILIGENNVGKSSIFEVLRKTQNKLIDIEEISSIAQSNREEFSANIENHEGAILSYESKYFVEEDPDNKIYITRQDFQYNFYHVNTNRKLTKKIGFAQLNGRSQNGKNENVEEKSDLYQIIQEIHSLSKDQKNEFCVIVNSFLPEIKRVFIQTNRRAGDALLSCKLQDDTIIDIRDMGSGIEQFIILLWILKFSNDKILVLDEPEISLHPKAQLRLMELLIESSKEKQIVVATHSPYIFKNCLKDIAGVFIFKKLDGRTVISNLKDAVGLFPWSPSWGEINYLAYDLATIDLHNELYGFLQYREKEYARPRFDAFLLGKGVPIDVKYIEDSINGPLLPYNVTLPTYIRNQIHHPENIHNILYSENQLKKSIDLLIGLI